MPRGEQPSGELQPRRDLPPAGNMASTSRRDNRSHDGADAEVVECGGGQLDARVMNRMHAGLGSDGQRFAATVFLRNLEPRRAAYVPRGFGLSGIALRTRSQAPI